MALPGTLPAKPMRMCCTLMCSGSVVGAWATFVSAVLDLSDFLDLDELLGSALVEAVFVPPLCAQPVMPVTSSAATSPAATSPAARAIRGERARTVDAIMEDPSGVRGRRRAALAADPAC